MDYIQLDFQQLLKHQGLQAIITKDSWQIKLEFVSIFRLSSLVVI